MRVIGVVGEGDKPVEHFHDVLRVVCVLPVVKVYTVTSQKIKLITLTVVNTLYTRFNPLANALTAVLRVFLRHLFEYFDRFLVYKLNNFEAKREGHLSQSLKHHFYIVKEVFGYEIFNFY